MGACGAFYAFVHGVIDAAIRGALPCGVCGFKELCRAVSGGAIDDDPFEVLVGLRVYGGGCVGQAAEIVERYGDDGEWFCAHLCP